MRTLMRRCLVPALCLGSALFTAPVLAACTIGNATLSFGELAAGTSFPDSLLGSVGVTCDSPADAFTLTIGRGLGTGNGPRVMQAADNGTLLPYRLASSMGGAEWGDAGCGDTYPAASTFSGAGSQQIPVYAGIDDTGLHVAAYADTVSVGLCNGTACNTGCLIDDRADIAVSASVRADCRIASVSAADFGRVNWNVPSVVVPALAGITLACAGDTSVLVGLGAGEHYDAALGRRMAAGGDYVPYALRTGSGSDWGDQGIDSAGSFPAPAVALPAGAIVTVTVAGEAFPAGAPPAAYSDRVTVTIQF